MFQYNINDCEKYLLGRQFVYMEEAMAKRNVREQLGFPTNSDTWTVNGVTQKIVWSKLEALVYDQCDKSAFSMLLSFYRK